jgi:ribosomal protein S18 acetylase RimI-like enzyme
VIVARQAGEVVGVFQLLESDEEVWPGAAPEDGLYLHSLAVRRSVAGHGVAEMLLAWARVATAARGRLELRLDCWAGNERLRRYYAEQGFHYRGDVTVTSEDGRTYACSRFAKRAIEPAS